MKGNVYTVYIQLPEDSTGNLLNSIIEAGIDALGVDAQLDETEWLDSYED